MPFTIPQLGQWPMAYGEPGLSNLQFQAQQAQVVPATSLQSAQAQYQNQLAQYNVQQQQFAEWARKFQEYEQAVAVQKDQQKGQIANRFSVGPVSLPAQQPPIDAALVQTHGGNALRNRRGRTRQEEALAARGRALAGRERSLEQKAAELRAEEIRESQEQAQLNAREAALGAQEQQVRALQSTLAVREQQDRRKEEQVQLLQSELVQEQRKIWKVLRSRSSVQSSPARPVAPVIVEPSPRSTVMPEQSSKAIAPMLRAARSPRLSLTQEGSSSRHRAAHFSKTKAATRSGSRSRSGSAAVSGISDLHVVTAANVPVGGFEESEDSTPTGSSSNNDNEDSEEVPANGGAGMVSKEDQEGKYADNDDLVFTSGSL